jgi:hypothetical protein
VIIVNLLATGGRPATLDLVTGRGDVYALAFLIGWSRSAGGSG